MEDLMKFRAECESHYNELRLSIQEVQITTENLTKRVETLGELTKDIKQLTTSTAVLATNMDAMLKEQQRQNARLETLESKPGKRWDSVVDKIIMLVIAALVGAVLVKLGLQ